jgi:MFS family permease
MHRHAMRSLQTWRPEPRAASMVPAVGVVWSAWLILMTGANLAAPLYPGYAERFDFSSFVLTLVFTTYAVALLPSLLIFGRLSDRIGRRPVMLAGLTSAGAGLTLFAFASSTAWLFRPARSRALPSG